MPQTVYNLDPSAARAGQAVKADTVLGKYAASEAIPPGRMCELHTDGTLRLYRGGKKAGVSMYRSTKPVGDDGDGDWQVDDYVPLLRRGQIWAEFDGTAADVAEMAGAQVHGADTTATDRGKFTAARPSGASDAQVYDAGPVKFFSAATADEGLVLLEVDLPAEDELPGGAAPVLVTHAANDFAIPARNGQVYEINTTAANSTVSLPAAAPNGTVCYILADGTKNGHTLTFRDVTTAISAATTASKRVAAVAVKAGGAWAVTLTVGP